MIVQCESCETRFHVADARIPEKGARVRCSRCHHRFHITPSSAAAAVSGDGSSGPPARGGDEQLDNPEFLFDDQTDQTAKTAVTRTPRTPSGTPPTTKLQKPPTPAVARKPEAAKPEAAKKAEARKPEARKKAEPVEKPAPAKPSAPEPPPEPVTEERVVATGGQTAQEMLDAGAPNLGSSKSDFGESLVGNDFGEEEDTGSRFLLGDDPPAKAPSAKPAAATFSKPATGAAKDAKYKDIDAAFGAGLADEDHGDAGWEALTRDTPGNVFEAGASFGLSADESPAAGSSDKRETAFDQPDVAPTSGKKPKRDTATFDPEARGSAGVIVRVAAALVGVALLGGALRGLRLQREANLGGAAVEQAAGWVAADVETFVARDSTGARVLVVRGNLFPDGAAPPPEVEVSLLETDGARVGEPRRAWLQRLDDAEIAPDRLAVRLASSAGDLSGMGPQVTGFTALMPDPPARARRISIALNAGKAAPRGTAIAVKPAPAAPAPPPSVPVQAPEPKLAPAPAPAPAPEVAPAPALAPPPAPPTATASEAVPARTKPSPAPSRAPAPAPAPEEIVPAAPAPE